MATYTKRVTTSGTERETRDAAQRVAGELMDNGYAITSTSEPFKDPDHNTAPDVGGLWSIDLTYIDLASKISVPADEPVAPAAAPASAEPEVEATPPPTDASVNAS